MFKRTALALLSAMIFATPAHGEMSISKMAMTIDQYNKVAIKSLESSINDEIGCRTHFRGMQSKSVAGALVGDMAEREAQKKCAKYESARDAAIFYIKMEAKSDPKSVAVLSREIRALFKGLPGYSAKELVLVGKICRTFVDSVQCIQDSFYTTSTDVYAAERLVNIRPTDEVTIDPLIGNGDDSIELYDVPADQ